MVIVGGGFSFSKLGRISVDKDLAGLEFAASIPGTVGGAIFMNAGAWGLNVSNAILKVDYLTENGEEQEFLKKEIKWGYRFSSFHELKGAILQAYFQLTPSKEVKNKLTDLIEKRKNSQPSGFSAGCVFRNGENYFAGELIEKCGLKGHRIGGAVISVKHGNFIMNDSNATAKDVLSLISLIKEEVKKKFSVDLKEEIRYLPH
jgi:UDP-N-acetylmuramate dehydrogenase